MFYKMYKGTISGDVSEFYPGRKEIFCSAFNTDMNENGGKFYSSIRNDFMSVLITCRKCNIEILL